MIHKRKITNKREWLKAHEPVVCMAVFFVVYFVVCLCCVPDYGISIDEPAQRQHSMVTYKYINKVLFHRDIPALDSYADLESYGALYGVALQIPMVLIEDLFHFQLSTRQIYLMRHLATFLICFVGYIFFYFALKKMFADRPVVPVLSTMLLMLYPRFFSLQFVDIKNMVFSAVTMMALFFMVLAVESPKVIWQVLFGMSVALAVNTRMMGVIYLALLFIYYLLTDATVLLGHWRQKEFLCKKEWTRLKKYLIVFASFALFWFLFTPKAWSGDPLGVFFNTYEKFSNYTSWDGTMVFMGHVISCDEMPWYYLLVWFAISIPVVQLALFAVGHVSTVVGLLKSRHPWGSLLTTYKWPVCAAGLFWGSVFAVIILHSRIYIGWHHMYYVFVPFCVLVGFGLDTLLRKTRKKGMIVGIMAIFLCAQCGWIVYNHPFQSSYFNIIGKSIAAQFDREEWRICSLQLLEWVLENDEGQFSISGETTSVYLLSDEQKQRIITEEKAKYIIEGYRNVIGNEQTYSGYEEVYTIWVDGYKIGSVFRLCE